MQSLDEIELPLLPPEPTVEVLPAAPGVVGDPYALILALDANSQRWALFEGTFNTNKGSIRVVVPIDSYPMNRESPRRPPNQAVAVAISVSMVRGLPIWMP